MASILNATTSTGFTVTPDNSGSLQLATNNGTTAVTIDTSQRVLINATSASGFDSGADNLIVGAGSGSNGITIYSGNTSTAGINFADGTTGSDIYAGGITYNHNTNNLDFSTTDGSGRMRINSAGNMSVGTTSDIARIGAVFDGNSNNGCVLRTSTNASGAGFLYFQQDTNTCGSVVRVGTTSAVTYSSTSDYRLKENIVPMTNGLDKVSRLKPVTYTWKQGGESAEGFIAHELAEVCPDAVVGTKDQVETYIDEDGNEQTRPKYQSIDTSFLVATLTAAIQEQQAQIKELKAEVQALKGVA